MLLCCGSTAVEAAAVQAALARPGLSACETHTLLSAPVPVCQLMHDSRHQPSLPPGLPPVLSGHSSALTMPCTWCSGRQCRMRSLGSQAHAAHSVSTCAARLAWVCSAPAGVAGGFSQQAHSPALMRHIAGVSKGCHQQGGTEWG